MNISRILITVFLFLLPHALRAGDTLVVKGIVSDESGNPLPSAIIRVYADPGKRMSGYTKTRADGRFTIRACTGDSLVCSLLGFETVHLRVREQAKETRLTMRETVTQLKEVSVKADRVRFRGDTITYNLGAFAHGEDKTLGDALAHVPGFDVDKSTGKISYEGKPISKFYVEGMDMLGGRYGAATNSLPQTDVAAVDVLNHHQPIKVLQDFTYSDDAAINVRLKDAARQRWISTWQAGLGLKEGGTLWHAEEMAMRMKSQWQSMFTLKSNNHWVDIIRETGSLLDMEAERNGEPLKTYISLDAPASPSIDKQRSLLNTSHGTTLNQLWRLTESAQLSAQVIYNHDNIDAHGYNRQVYHLGNTEGDTISNKKDYRQRKDNLYAQVKYEGNADKYYLRNSLSGEFTWDRQILEETGSTPHMQEAHLPTFVLKDNLYAIRRYGRRLVSFYSNNTVEWHPQDLDVDGKLSQDVSQRRIATDTYAMGSWNVGKSTLSGTMGVCATLRHIRTDLDGWEETGGMETDDKSFFGYARLYLSPKWEYNTRDVRLRFSMPFSYQANKYQGYRSKHRCYLSPSASIRWRVTARTLKNPFLWILPCG